MLSEDKFVRKYSKILSLFWLAVSLGDIRMSASNYYIRADASGANTGADWNNAWTDVTSINWNAVAAGAKIWIAGGTYGKLTIGKSGVAKAIIYIARVRSTNTEPTSAAGWDPAYDSPVTLNLISCLGHNYWTLDGQIPYGGIMITNVSPDDGYCIDFSNGGVSTVPSSYVTLLNLNISGAVTDNSSFTNAPETRCINWNFDNAGHGFKMSYCYLAYAPTLMSLIGAWDGAVISHNKFTQNNNGGNSSNHKNVIQSTGGTNIILAYNEIFNWANEGLMFDPIGTDDAPNDGWDIYGNIIYWDWEGVARFPESQNNPQYRIRIFNNTFADLGLATTRTANNGSWDEGCMTSNNIVLHCGSAVGAPVGIGFGLGTDDFNLSDASLSGPHSISGATTAIFVNYSGRDYHIVSNIAALFPRQNGVILPAQYATDIVGNLRGTDGEWGIGAYEYSTNYIPAASTLNYNADVNGSLMLSWTAPGFKLQSQTNTLTTGLGTNWSDYPGGSNSPVCATIDLTQPTVFFRLSQ